MRNNKFTPEKPTTELFVDSVLTRTFCNKHKADKGMPCWILETAAGTIGRGACNKRAKAAGFNHPISPNSLRMNRNTPPRKK